MVSVLDQQKRRMALFRTSCAILTRDPRTEGSASDGEVPAGRERYEVYINPSIRGEGEGPARLSRQVRENRGKADVVEI